MRKLPVFLRLAAFLTACVSLPSRSTAQHEVESPKLRADCRLATQTLEKGRPAPKWDWALEQIARCDDSGGPALAALWASPPSDTANLNALYTAGSRLRDGRLADALIAASRSASTPRLARLTALRILGEYSEPAIQVPLQYLMPSRDSGKTVERGHWVQLPGSVPVDDAKLAQIRQAIEALVTDADPVVAFAARYLKANAIR